MTENHFSLLLLSFRWLVAGIMITFSLYVAFAQWYGMYSVPKKLNDLGKPRHYSIAPLGGGLTGVIGCWVAPSGVVSALWWVPLVLDPGCAFLLLVLMVAGLGHVLKSVFHAGP